jgi:hypothetical protein
VQLDLVAVDRELFAERQHVGGEPGCKDASRIEGIGALQLLGVLQIIIHNRETLQHHWDGNVVYRKGHIDLHLVGFSPRVLRKREHRMRRMDLEIPFGHAFDWQWAWWA